MEASIALKSRLDALRPLGANRIALLWPQWKAEDALFVYATNAVEGSTLTLGETLAVLEHGIIIGGHSMAEHLDVLNGQKAYTAMLDLAQKRASITLETVLELHHAVVGKVTYVGELRDEPRLIGKILARYDESVSAGEHPVRVASELHFDLLTVHPFKEGNGRTARLLENLHLIGEGFVPILIGPQEKQRYFDVLQRSELAIRGVGDTTEFIRYTVDLEEESLERYLKSLKTAHGQSIHAPNT